MQSQSIPVLIVGGSLVGLSAAVFLAWRGVRVIVVEKHRGSSPHPRAIGFTPRTMELLRAAGIADRIEQGRPGFKLRRVRVESLAGKVLGETDWTPPSKKPEAPVEYSPYPVGAAIAQDRLEPLLRNRALELGADIRQATELVSFTQNKDGVIAVLQPRDGGPTYEVRADYMLAADGSKSAIREALGIKRKGRGHIKTLRSVLFRAPLEEYLQSGASQFEIDQGDFKAFLTTYQDGRWVLMFEDDEERSEAQLHEAIRRATGRNDITAEIITTGRWELEGMIAERYSEGRVFLAGDAAHTLPPTRGGFGANTGIDDVHNLAWKLAAVLEGKAKPALLDTYSDERQPIGWLRHQQTFARPDYASVAQGIAAGETILPDAAMEFGQLYRSNSIQGAPANLPPARKPEEWQGQPGTRAPHLWGTQNGQRASTLDLLQRGWVLLAANAAWQEPARQAAQDAGVPLQVVCVDSEFQSESPNAVLAAFGLQNSGATLVRPDGYIAWRSPTVPQDPRAELTVAFVRSSGAR